jgi:dynein heavy chain
MSARGNGTRRIPAPPRTAKKGGLNPRGRGSSAVTRAAAGAELFSEVFGGGGEPTPNPPKSISPPFEEEDEAEAEEAQEEVLLGRAGNALAAGPGGTSSRASGSVAAGGGVAALMEHIANYQPPKAAMKTTPEQQVGDPAEQHVRPALGLTEQMRAVVSRRVIHGREPWERVRCPAQEVEVALAEAGVPMSELRTFPPVEAFDDTGYELREPADWLAAAEDGERQQQVAGQYLNLETGSIVVRPCQVTADGYDAESNSYALHDDADAGAAVQVPRCLLLFDGEDVALFAQRLAAAVAGRERAVRLLQYRLCVRDMPNAKGEVVLPLDQLDRILQLVFNTERLKTGRIDSSGLLKEVYNDFVQVVNGLVLDHKASDPEMAADLAAIKPPTKAPVPVPDKGQKVIASHSRLTPTNREAFADTTYMGRSEAISAMKKIVGECVDMRRLDLFETKFDSSCTLAEYEEVQKGKFDSLKLQLVGISGGVGSHIQFGLHDVEPAWRELHEMKFTLMANKRLQDSLRELEMAGLGAYRDFIRSICALDVHVNAVDDVMVVTNPAGIRAGTDATPPLIRVALVLADPEVAAAPAVDAAAGAEAEAGAEGDARGELASEPEPEAEPEPQEAGDSMVLGKVVAFDTSTRDIQAVMLKLFDQVVEVLQGITAVDLPYTRDEAFELRLQHGGSMPVFHLDAPQLTEPAIQAIRDDYVVCVDEAIRPLNEFLELFRPFLPFIQLDIDAYIASLDPEKPLEELRDEVALHRDQTEVVLATIPANVKFGQFFEVNCVTIRDFLAEKHSDLAQRILEHITSLARLKTDSICETFDEMLVTVETPPTNVEEIHATREYLESIPKLIQDLQDSIDTVGSMKDELENCQFSISDGDFNKIYKAIMWPATLKKSASAVEGSLIKLEEGFLNEMEGEQVEFDKELKDVTAQVNDFSKNTDITKVKEVSAAAQAIADKLESLNQDAKKFKSRSAIFDVEVDDYEELSKTQKEFDPYRALWITADVWIERKKEWQDGLFTNIDADDLENVVQDSFKTMFKQARFFSQKGVEGCASVATQLRDEIDEFKPCVPVAKALRNPGMRARHWNDLSAKLTAIHGEGTKAIEVDDDGIPVALTLRAATDDYKMSSEAVLPSVLGVAEVAAKEFQIEKMLDKMLGLWKPLFFNVTLYKKTETYIIKGSDEINTLLDDHIVGTQAMSFSPYKAVFQERITEWEQTLSNIQDITTEWLAVQRNWMYLQPIFESEDIMRQLPTEGKKFREVDRVYRSILGAAHKNPNVLHFCKNEDLLDKFTKANESLEFVQKNLNDYLETKRACFARFYFLSNDELIEILSQTKEPTAVQPHLKKCFEAIAQLEFQKDKEMTAMYSGEKECVQFTAGVYPEGEVEFWLGDIEKMMQLSVKTEMKKAILAYKGGEARKQWTLDWPGMCVLQASQVYWTKDLAAKLQGNGTAGVKEFYDMSVQQLNDLTALVRTKLSKLGKKTMGALIVMEVHARDVVERFLENNVDSQANFEWLSQLRYYWDDGEWQTSAGKTSGLVAKMCQCVYPYGYEYLGNSGRLVITPLTDRCYMTLMGAMHLNLGGAPAGPAGTGKTESVKDLAKALAKHCVVFNCSDGLDYLQMAKFFKGLATEGAWACFDEFNRIDVEVLSVVAQQILSIQQGIARGMEKLLFQGTDIVLNATFNVFITMNPGYAGRTELPDNLKVLFRPMSMMVPDYALIAEIRNVSFGFDKSKSLAQKLVATFKLSSEQLSSQCHYDYGMRAVNTVIGASGLLKQQFPEMDEDELLFRAVRDSNKPKFLTDDITLFEGIMSDVFSGTKEPTAEYPKLEDCIKKYAQMNDLQCIDLFKLKCIQLYEMTTVRHGMMLVGPTGGGKSAIRSVLQQAITESHGGIEEFDRVRVYAMNPKSITMGQLYGAADLQTNEWTDGIASVMVRHCSNPDTEETGVTGDHIKWVYFDGPVDAIWIENMNTVLDDNKKLCLNSGEIIQLSDTMRIMFEVEDLKHASPATVSRCGMIWVETAPLMPKENEPSSGSPLIKSFLETLPPPVKKASDQLAKLFDIYLFTLLEHTRKNVSETVKTVGNNLIKSLNQLLSTYFLDFVPKHEDDVVPDFDAATVEPFFLWALIWSIGASADSKGRVAFEKCYKELIQENETTCGPPTTDESSIYDYKYDVADKKWKQWMTTIPEFSIQKGAEFADILVPTVDTVRTSFVLEQLVLKGFHVMVVGDTGTSKTVVIHDRLKNGMPENYEPILMGFSAQTSANMTQDIIDGKMDKRRQGRDQNPDNSRSWRTMKLDTGLDYTQWGPPVGRKSVIMVDDFNMPMCETYDAQPPIEVLRTMVDYFGWYDRKTYRYRNLVDVSLVGAMGPPGGGRNPVTPRMLRHFNFLSLVDMSDASIRTIYGTILKNHLSAFADEVMETANAIVDATISIYNTVKSELLPTPMKSHYLFNLRDVASAIQGTMQTSPKKTKEPNDLVRVWTHEMRAVFADRFVTEEDRVYFKELTVKAVQEFFGVSYDEIVTTPDLLFVDFLVPGTDFESRLYEEAPAMEDLQKLVVEYLDDYNAQNVPMDLIMFGDAVKHISKISRVIRQPLGHALLLGVGGSGRKSLARLSAAIAEFTFFSIEINKNYRLMEWREDLKQVLLKAGRDGKKMEFMFDDTQIVTETFLEDINNILNSAEVPNLMKDEDLGPIFDAMTPLCKDKNIPCTKMNMYGMFISRVKANLHLVICMSPVGDEFRSRLRMFPALVNCCTIDWFTAWPEEALISVAKSQLTVEVGGDEILAGIIKMCGKIHLSVQAASDRYLEEMNRHNYVTPTSYLELLKSVNVLIDKKRGEIQIAIKRLQNGLDKLNSTNVQVEELKKMLEEKQPVLKKTLEEVAEQQIVITEEKGKAAVIKTEAETVKAAASVKAAEVKVIADDAQADLDKALPALDNAVKCLKELQKNDIVEVKGMGKPPAGVKLVLHGVCIMFGVKAVKEKDPDGGGKIDNWHKAAAPMLSNPNKFLTGLMEFDKDNIAEDRIVKVGKLVEDENFQPEKIAKVSKACTAICTWVHAMHTYYYIARDVEPKRQALAAAQAELDDSNAKLAKAQAELDAVTEKLAQLEAAFNEAIATKERLEAEVEQCTAKLGRADQLIGGLGGEAVRWGQTVEQLKVDAVNIIGDVLVSAGTISYLGPFMQVYRTQIEQEWSKGLTELSIPHTPGCTMMGTLVDPVRVRQWNIQGLPSDDFSISNAIIMDNSTRWPLMIDPQTQANKWIKKKEEANQMVVLKASASATLVQRSLENCIQFGRPLLVENIGESMDPLYEPVLANATFKTSTGEIVIKLGDQTIPFHEDFKFYMTTILPNPHYTPEVSVKVALLNFTITPGGLEEQLLNATVEAERADLAELKTRLISENAENMRKIKELEDKILMLLSNSKGDILDDEVLIETLGVSKVTSNEINQAVAEAEKTEKEIDATRELYRPVAFRGAVLFFAIADLCIVDPMYQYSLGWFKLLFRNAFDGAKGSDNLQQRLVFLMDYFLLSLYQNVCRSLFEKDKLMFAFNLCVRIRQGAKQIDPIEWRFLLTGPTKKIDEAKPDDTHWLTDTAWNEILNMCEIPVFNGFIEDFRKNLDHYKEYYDSAKPEEHAQMAGWDDKLNSLHKMIVLRCLRPDKVINSMQLYIQEHLDQRFLEPPPFDLAPCYEESVSTAPLIFVLVAGADPTTALINFADSMGMMGGKYHAISLGQGQGPKAEALINKGTEAGHWVLLQNCHLAVSWMSTLEAIVESFDPEKVNPKFRLWLTSMPSKVFPVAVLQNGIKMTNEPPKGLRANLSNSYFAFNDEFLNKTKSPPVWRKLLFAMCMYHAIIQERRKFGPLGWNILYEYNDSDKEVNVLQLAELIEQNEEVPYDVIRILAGHVNYGGRVTDDLDRRTLMTGLEDFITPEVLRDDYSFSPSGDYLSPPDGDYDSYIEYIRNLPINAYPEVYGLHENADITCAQNETYATLDTLLSLQPRVSGGGGVSRDDVLMDLATDILKRIPDGIDFEEVTKKFPVMYEESMNTVLQQEVRWIP